MFQFSIKFSNWQLFATMENKANINTLKRNTKKYEEYLDSDDEFPCTY